MSLLIFYTAVLAWSWLTFETQDPEEWIVEHCETAECLP